MLVALLGNDDGSTLFWANMIAGSLEAAPAAILSTPADAAWPGEHGDWVLAWPGEQGLWDFT
jgi:hypothetical protein